MSTYDRQGPGTDPTYCEGLEAFEAPEPDGMEPIGELAYTLNKTLTEADQLIAAADSPEQIHALWRELRQASYRLDALVNLAGVKADTF